MVGTRLLPKQWTFKDKKNLPLARNTKLASATNHKNDTQEIFRAEWKPSFKNIQHKHDQRFKHPAMKMTLKFEEGPKIQKFGEKSCSCNNWRLPGEPRSLGDYTLSDRLFNQNASNEFFQLSGFLK